MRGIHTFEGCKAFNQHFSQHWYRPKQKWREKEKIFVFQTQKSGRTTYSSDAIARSGVSSNSHWWCSLRRHCNATRANDEKEQYKARQMIVTYRPYSEHVHSSHSIKLYGREVHIIHWDEWVGLVSAGLNFSRHSLTLECNSKINCPKSLFTVVMRWIILLSYQVHCTKIFLALLFLNFLLSTVYTSTVIDGSSRTPSTKK